VTTALEIASQVRSGQLSARAILEACLETIESRDKDVHAFLHLSHERARARAQAVDQAVASSKDPGRLAGVPIALKDNLCTRGIPTTCASRILQGWKPPYDATVVSRLEAEGAVIVGKTNMDEFAFGSSTEHSAFGPTRNPRDLTRVPGGSSGGSAAAVAAGMVPVALGSDTGGSIRQPAAFCGVVGIKPTYGLVSRYGLVAFASSLDQIGPFGATVADAVALLEVISGHDPMDSTSLPEAPVSLSSAMDQGVDGLSIGIVRELADAATEDVRSSLAQAARTLEAAGAHVEEVSLPVLTHTLGAYYLIGPAEASSNLSRYDGVRYGLRVEAPDTASMNAATRAAGFGAEAKRRIMLGTYALSKGYYDAYYVKAQKVRTLVIKAFEEAYSRFDALLSPTTPTVAFPFGAKTADPLEMYRSDVCTIPTNLAGHPALSLPFGTGEDGLPVGLQVMAPALGEHVMVRVACVLEAASQSLPAGPTGAGPTGGGPRSSSEPRESDPGVAG
jgi:aspartyl-tRNA(Asn)/glutamyl-tRNA(Gln) amidotransferase subunit A